MKYSDVMDRIAQLWQKEETEGADSTEERSRIQSALELAVGTLFPLALRYDPSGVEPPSIPPKEEDTFPLSERFLPATIYLATHILGGNSYFWNAYEMECAAIQQEIPSTIESITDRYKSGL